LDSGLEYVYQSWGQLHVNVINYNYNYKKIFQLQLQL